MKSFFILVIRHQQKLFRLTNTEKEQVQLNSIRQMFTYLSSIIVFLLAGVIIKTKEDGNNELTWDDCWSMQSLCYIISAIGLATTVLFQLFTPEKATSTNMLESTMVATIRFKLFFWHIFYLIYFWPKPWIKPTLYPDFVRKIQLNFKGKLFICIKMVQTPWIL